MNLNQLQKENLRTRVNINVINIKSQDSFSSSSYYKCPTCFYKTSSYTFLMVHFRSVHRDEKNPFVCHHEGCDFQTITSGLLAVHMRKHRIENIPTITIPSEPIENAAKCSTNTNINGSSSSSAVDKDHSNKDKDKDKNQNTEDWRMRTGISNDDNGDRPYRCGLCPFTCNSSQTISYHRTYGHVDNLKCPYCNYSTSKSDNLERHQKLHETMVGKPQCKLEKTWICSEENCQFQTLDNKVVAIHLRRFHNLPKIYINSGVRETRDA